MLMIITLIFAVLSIVFLLGKGSFLIAGYNTASKEEKQRYDEKKLCRLMGIGFFVITVGFFGISLLEEKGIIFMPACIFIGLFIIFFGVRYCYSVNPLKQDHKHDYKKKDY